MVTAGVYMCARSAAIFTHAPIAMETVAMIGLATAVFAATEDWGSASSSGGDLTARIERAGAELAALIDRSQPAAPADPYASVPSFEQLLRSR